MKSKLFAFTVSLALVLTACDSTPHYDANTMAALQPCMSMGFQPAQCMAAYQQAGRPQSTDTNWLGTVAAFAAGAAANHWWNRNAINDYRQYQFRPDYMSQPDYYERNYNTPQRRTWVTPQVQGIPSQDPTLYKSSPSVPQLVPEKNTTVVIPGQKVQPLFANPTNIAPNQVTVTQQPTKPPVVIAPSTTNTVTTTTTPAFKPIQVAPPTPAPAPAKKSWSLFGGSSTTTSAPKPSSTTAATPTVSKPATSTFKPIRVAPPSKSYSSSSKRK